MIKILQIIDLLHWGGAQKMQVFLADQLAAYNVELTVVSAGVAPATRRSCGLFPVSKVLFISLFFGAF